MKMFQPFHIHEIILIHKICLIYVIEFMVNWIQWKIILQKKKNEEIAKKIGKEKVHFKREGPFFLFAWLLFKEDCWIDKKKLVRINLQLQNI